MSSDVAAIPTLPVSNPNFAKVIQALDVSTDAALTVLARISKIYLKDFLTDEDGEWTSLRGPLQIHLLEEKSFELREECRVYTLLRQITIKPSNENLLAISDEFRAFCYDLKRMVSNEEVSFIDGLVCHLQQASKVHFTFSWKMRYMLKS